SRQSAFGSDVLMSLPTFRQLTTVPGEVVPGPDEPILTRVLARTQPEVEGLQLSADMNERFSRDYPLWIQVLEVQLEFAEQNALQQRILLLVLTSISFTTAVFGVFAVIYVTIYARRIEIGMMKAIGMRNFELTGTLIVEAIAMTLSSALAGITAGTAMGLVVYVGETLGSGRPFVFALDGVVGPFIVLMVVLASIIGASFSARRIIKRRAIEILRMV
ncbi:MAG: ABC transporter permease, partial [Anaerolineales bacterium]|nr:ABC transporter permease [Anaerolineales bacterium]